MPERLLDGHSVLPSEGAQKGVQHLATDVGPVPNLGQARLGFAVEEQHKRGVAFQVAAGERPLLAVSALAKGGADTRFSTSG
eukprot:15336467-Alexandrium_andersonii.AAC.1